MRTDFPCAMNELVTTTRRPVEVVASRESRIGILVREYTGRLLRATKRSTRSLKLWILRVMTVIGDWREKSLFAL